MNGTNTMSEEKVAVDLVLQQAEDLGRQLHDCKEPELAACGVHRQATALTLKMIAPLYKAFNNGGLPSKKAGASIKIGPLEITGERAFRAVLLTLVVFIAAMLCGLRVQYDNGQLNIGSDRSHSATAKIQP
jgi:hypothetical protein